MAELICKYCGKQFKRDKSRLKYGRGKYCSRDCQYKGISLNRTDEYNCPICDKKFRSQKSVKRIFCSQECRLKNQENPKKEFNCVWCKKHCFYKDFNFERGVKYCSRSCYSNHKSELFKGDKSHFWKGGLTEMSMIIRGSREYKLWRTAVFERDNFTCIWCGIRGGRLEADHIKPFSLFPELRFAIDNGRTLCRDCHKTTDTYGFKAIK